MNVSCPRCGSAKLELRPGLAETGWSCIKAGIFVLLANFLLPMSVAFQFVSVIAMILSGLFLHMQMHATVLSKCAAGNYNKWAEIPKRRN